MKFGLKYCQEVWGVREVAFTKKRFSRSETQSQPAHAIHANEQDLLNTFCKVDSSWAPMNVTKMSWVEKRGGAGKNKAKNEGLLLGVAGQKWVNLIMWSLWQHWSEWPSPDRCNKNAPTTDAYVILLPRITIPPTKIQLGSFSFLLQLIKLINRVWNALFESDVVSL